MCKASAWEVLVPRFSGRPRPSPFPSLCLSFPMCMMASIHLLKALTSEIRGWKAPWKSYYASLVQRPLRVTPERVTQP